MTRPEFAELAARSNFTFLDGASHPRELVRRAKALGYAGMAICDANSLAGVVRGHVAAKANPVEDDHIELPYRVGCRLLLIDGSEWLAWPSDRDAYGRLTALLSKGRMREKAPKGECHIDRAMMFAAADGWVLAAVPPADPDEAFAEGLREAATALRGRLALPLLLAASCTQRGDDRQRLDRLAGMAARAGAELLATGDVRYHDPSRRRLADVVTAIRLHTTVDALGHHAEPNAERHLKPPAEVARLFAGYPEALANTIRVLDATQGFKLGDLCYEYPEELLEDGYTAQETLERRVAEALETRWAGGAPAFVRERVAQELQLIAKLGYAPYFLTVHEIVRFARGLDEPILCQGRGSAANSAVCYALGVTAADPVKHDLLFERFLSASRGEPPDIDIDFEHERREDVIQHLYERYGRERAAICATLICYRPRSAIREVGKAMGLTEDVTARLAKASWGPHGDRDPSEIAAEEGLDATDPRLAMAMEMAAALIGFPRHTATHVGGFVITRGKLVELAVVSNAAMQDRTVLEWDKDDIEALGILKVDVLGLGMLSCLKRCFDLLRQHAHLDFELSSLPKECPKTYEMLRKADSIGVFQVESRAQMNMLPRLRPEKFYDLVIEVAIVRPGPIAGGMVHPYLRRRAGLERVTYPSPTYGEPNELYQVLHKTLGVPLFQEQAMRIAIVAAGFTNDEADQLRRAMATFKMNGKVDRYRDKLVAGMVRRGYEQDFAERLFKQIEGFGDYGFPESHAASFALLVYASAWVKCHHPAVFACALINSQPMGFYAPAQLVRDAREHGVAIRPIDVNASAWDCTLEPEAGSANGLALRLGLRMVASLGQEEAEAIAGARHARNGAPFASVEELARRTGIGRRALDALAAADAFAGLGAERRRAAWDARGVSDGPHDLPLFAQATDPLAEEAPLIAEPAPALVPATEGETVVEDYRAIGLTLRRHPMALLRPQLNALRCADTRQFQDARQGASLRLAGLVLMRQRPGSAKGVVFLTVEDEYGVANLVTYPDVAMRYRAALVAGRLLLAEGRVERVVDHAEVPITHLIIRSLTDRSDLLDGLLQPEDAPDGMATREARMPPSRDFR